MSLSCLMKAIVGFGEEFEWLYNSHRVRTPLGLGERIILEHIEVALH